MYVPHPLRYKLTRHIRSILIERKLLVKNVAKEINIKPSNLSKFLSCNRRIKVNDAISILMVLGEDTKWLHKEIEMYKQGSVLSLADKVTPMPPHTISLTFHPRSLKQVKGAVRILVRKGVLKSTAYTKHRNMHDKLIKTIPDQNHKNFMEDTFKEAARNKFWVFKHYKEAYVSPELDVHVGIGLRTNTPGCLVYFTDLHRTPTAAKIYNYLIRQCTSEPPVISRIDFPIDYNNDISEMVFAQPRAKTFKTYMNKSMKGGGRSTYIGQRYVCYQRENNTDPTVLRMEARLRPPQISGKRPVLGKELQNLKNPFAELHLYRLQPCLMTKSQLTLLVKYNVFCIQHSQCFDEFSDCKVSREDPYHPFQVWDQVYDRYLFDLAQCLGIKPEELGIHPKITFLRRQLRKKGLMLSCPRDLGTKPFHRRTS